MKNISNTFLSNNPVLHTDGEKYLVLETSDKTPEEMLVLRLSNNKAYHYHNGVFSLVDLDKHRVDGQFFGFGVIHNWVAGELPEKSL